MRAPPGMNMFDVVVSQRVVTKHFGFTGWQIKKGSALALRQNGAMRHVSFAFTEVIIYICL